ncbi:MAG: RpiB/LacA/LacB family sugar-phosphate isomerase [Acidobacteriota bacterium]
MKAFDIITESDARVIEYGATVALAPGGHITPLARDTLRERRITVVPGGSVDPALPSDLAPPAEIRRVSIGSDHTGVGLKAELVQYLRAQGLAVEDVGTETKDPVDYPDIAAAVARQVVRREADAGIVIDGAGIGSAIAANKVRGARAVMATNATLARYGREHNGANVLTLGSTLVSPAEAREIVQTFLATPMREARYIRRLLKIRDLERP